MQSGVILAGGRSRRFGDADKALAELGGTPMVRRVADRVAGVIDELVVNCRPDQRGPVDAAMAGYALPVAFAPDAEPDRGPVAGVRNGLRAARGAYALVVACDMPLVDPALVAHLFERAAGREAAVPRTDDGGLQPTQAVYRGEAMADACERALAGGEPALRGVLSRLDYALVDGDELRGVCGADTFENVNTREQLAALEQRLGG